MDSHVKGIWGQESIVPHICVTSLVNGPLLMTMFHIVQLDQISENYKKSCFNFFPGAVVETDWPTCVRRIRRLRRLWRTLSIHSSTTIQTLISWVGFEPSLAFPWHTSIHINLKILRTEMV